MEAFEKLERPDTVPPVLERYESEGMSDAVRPETPLTVILDSFVPLKLSILFESATEFKIPPLA